jgi:hypothetical protein
MHLVEQLFGVGIDRVLRRADQQRRDDDAFLKDLFAIGRRRAGGHPADVGEMRDTPRRQSIGPNRPKPDAAVIWGETKSSNPLSSIGESAANLPPVCRHPCRIEMLSGSY